MVEAGHAVSFCRSRASGRIVKPRREAAAFVEFKDNLARRFGDKLVSLADPPRLCRSFRPDFLLSPLMIKGRVQHFRECALSTFLPRLGWEDWYHSETYTLNIKLHPGGGYSLAALPDLSNQHVISCLFKLYKRSVKTSFLPLFAVFRLFMLSSFLPPDWFLADRYESGIDVPICQHESEEA